MPVPPARTESSPQARLIEAGHLEGEDSLRGGKEVAAAGQPSGPQLHAAMLHIIANQMLACEPPETGEVLSRLAALGYEWPNITHMVAAIISNPGYRCRGCPARGPIADNCRG